MPPNYKRKNGKLQAGLREGSPAVMNDEKSSHSQLTGWAKQGHAVVSVSGLGEHSRTLTAGQMAVNMHDLYTWLSFCLVPAWTQN